MWMNVDYPDKCCTVHKKSCSYVLSSETTTKGIERNLKDGGWYQFESISDAENNHRSFYGQLRYKKCKKCFKHLEI